MENKAHALAAGIFVLVVAALLVALAMWLMRDNTNVVPYELVSDSAVTGLQAQAQVRYKGVPVGRVTSVSIDPERPSRILVRIAVEPHTPIGKDTSATLQFQGITGLSYVALDDARNGPGDALPPGPRGRPPQLVMQPNALGQLTDMAGQMAARMGHIADRLDALLSDENQQAFSDALQQVGAAARSADTLAQTASKTLSSQFDPARTNLPRLIEQATRTLASVDSVARQATRTMANVDRAVQDASQGLQRATGPDGAVTQLVDNVSGATAQALPQLRALSRDSHQTLQRVDRAADLLLDNPQALVYGKGAIPPGPGEPGFVAPVRPGKYAPR